MIKSTLLVLLGSLAISAAPAAFGGEFKFTQEEAQLQYSNWYNMNRRRGLGHHSAASAAKAGLRNNGFPPRIVTGKQF